MTATDIYFTCTNKNTDYPSEEMNKQIEITNFFAFNFHFVDRIFFNCVSNEVALFALQRKIQVTRITALTVIYFIHNTFKSVILTASIFRLQWPKWRKTIENELTRRKIPAKNIPTCTRSSSLCRNVLLFYQNSTFSCEKSLTATARFDALLLIKWTLVW